MKEIKQEEITQAVKELCIQANYELPEDVQQALRYACQEEDSVLGKQTLSILEDNAMIAKNIPYAHLSRYGNGLSIC